MTTAANRQPDLFAPKGPGRIARGAAPGGQRPEILSPERALYGHKPPRPFRAGEAGAGSPTPGASPLAILRRPVGAEGFTLVELMLVVGILVLLLVIIGSAWRSLTQSGVEAKAINMISSFASVARTYAMRYQLETVLTIDPNTGQLDMWVWDTLGDPANNILPNSRYVLAPVLDTTARLPRKGGTQLENLAVRVAPIDWDNGTPGTGDDLTYEALARFAMCFDPQGRLVVRDLRLVWGPGTPAIAGTPIGLTLLCLAPDGIPPRETGWDPWVNVRTSCAGWVYEPPEGSQAPNGAADPRLPATVGVPIAQGKGKPFMLNQYTGRVIQGGQP
jgi:type II secretory pathway pseudopilin PulG